MADRNQAAARARLRSLSQLTNEFTDRWFPGGDAFTPEDKPWVPVHDGGHVYANTAPVPPGDSVRLARGERQQWVVDASGLRELRRKTGASGFVNQFTHRTKPTAMHEVYDRIRTQDFMDSDAVNVPELRKKWWYAVEERGGNVDDRARDPGFQPMRANDWKLKSLDEINSSKNLYVPPIGDEEFYELARRGREYYGQIADQSKSLFGEPKPSDLRVDKSIAGVQAGSRMPVNAVALAIHENPGKIMIRGGYDTPGALPFGSVMEHVEKPKHPAIDMGLYLDKASKEIKKEVMTKQGDWNAAISNRPLGPRQIAELEADLLKHGDRMADAYGFGAGGPLVAGMRDFDFQADPAAMQLQSLKNWRQQASIGERDTMLRLPRSPEAAEIGATLREVERVRGAVGQGARAGATALGSLPLLDPEFRDAVDRRDGGRAAAVTAKNLAIGAGAEVAAGFGAGVLQRTAPRVAARALPVLGTAAGAASAAGLATLAPGSAPVPTQVGRYGGAPVYHRSQDDSYVGINAKGKPVRLGRAKLGGKDVFVPFGSVAGTSVGPAVVGKPWWDRSGQESTAQRVTREAFPEARPVPARTPSGVARLTKPTKRGPDMEGVMRQVPALGLLNPGRVRDAARAWNPGRGEFGVSELLFGR